ncbi:hypothetical protein BH23BAC1_BH23BAC1_17510 [soil metagenome]
MSLSEEDVQKNKSHDFYKMAIELLVKKDFPFLMGGAYALRLYTGIHRDTKDLDIFCRPTDYQRILKEFSDLGYKVELSDPRWIAKVYMDNHYIDIIFNTTTNLCMVDDSWFEHAVQGEMYDIPVRFIAAEELYWSKSYVQNRERYDGADLNHIILRNGQNMDWKRVLTRLDQHWHLLLSQFLNFQFVYPANRDLIPRWLFDELLERAKIQYDLPTPMAKVCLGPLVDHTQYKTDIIDWGYKTITTLSI